MVQTERQRKQELWEQRIEDHRKSSMLSQAWCELNGFKYNELRYRLRKQNMSKRLGGPEPPKTSWPGLAEGGGLSVRVGKTSIDVLPGFDPNLLRQIVELLSSC